MTVRNFATLDRDICQPLGRIIQEAFTDGINAYDLENKISYPLKIYGVDLGEGVDVKNIFSKLILDGNMGNASAYPVQAHIETLGSFTVNEILGLSAYLNLGTGAITASGRVAALQAMISGDGVAGTVSGELYVAYIANRGTMIDTDAVLFVHNQDAAGATSMVKIENQSDTPGRVTNVFELDVGNTTNFFNIKSIEGSVETQSAGALTITEKLKVKIGENTRYIAVGTIA